jgi:hypothetical protein
LFTGPERSRLIGLLTVFGELIYTSWRKVLPMVKRQFVQQGAVEIVREFVKEQLCERNKLEKDAFEMSQRVLVQRGDLCGFYFCIYGPRSVRLTAVWDLRRKLIFFYDSLGRRAESHPVPLGV